MGEREFFELDARLGELQRRTLQQDSGALEALRAELEIGWIQHDNALEGIVLSRQEIQAALAGAPLPDDHGGALFSAVRNLKTALDFIQRLGQLHARQTSMRGLITVSLLTELHELLTPTDKPKGSSYRRKTSMHRVHHHAIAAADTIPHRLRQLCASLDELPNAAHPLAVAAVAHFELMTIYPWQNNSGKVARLLMNLLLLRTGYPPAIISGGERQRYYESLNAENDRLAGLITDSLTQYSIAAHRFFDKNTV